MISALLALIAANPYTTISILFGLYEIIARLKPTKRNLSILDKIHTILNFIIPNLKDGKDKDKAVQIHDAIDEITKFKQK